MATAPMPQETIAAGPAVASAPWAPKSHPEPMIEPPEAHSRPMNPISLGLETLLGEVEQMPADLGG
jgi:hypothetical protein